MTSKQTQTIVASNNPYLILNNQGKTLHRLELTANQHILGRDPQQADLIVPDDWQVISRCQAYFRKVGNDYQIYDGHGGKPSSNGLFINHSRISPTEGYTLEDGMELQIGQNPQNLIILTYFNPRNPKSVTSPSQRFISLKNKSVMLGRDTNANLQLDAPTVSRCHAIIDSDGRGTLCFTRSQY